MPKINGPILKINNFSNVFAVRITINQKPVIYLLHYEGKNGFEQNLLVYYETEFVGRIKWGWEKCSSCVVGYVAEHIEHTWQLF